MSDRLVVTGLKAGYGKVPVVTEVSFHIETGETVALVGRNGAGKTTSLAAVCGMRYGPSGGSVQVGERDITGLRPNAIAATGVKLVPEGRRIFRSMTVFENLRIGAFPHRRDRPGIDETFDLVHELFPALATFSKRRAGELSGGQQQMVAIGQALMSRPRFLLLDEPSSGLAPALVDEMYDRFEELARRNVGLLIVDQSVERVLERASRYYLMESGTIVSNGPSEPGAIDLINDVILGRPAATR